MLGLLMIIFASCSKRDGNVYDINNFSRITSDEDSLKEMRVVYLSKIDEAFNMIRTYYNDGSLMGISYYKNHKRTGPWIQFLNSKVSFEGNFLNGMKIGLHKYYYQNGAPYIVEEYQNGKMVSKVEYSENGVVVCSKKF